MNRSLQVFCVALLISGTGCYGCEQIEPGHAGILTKTCSGGGVQKDPLGVGWHTEGPCEDIVEFPTFQQTLVMDRVEPDDSISATSSEGLPINIDVSLSYTVDTAKVPSIYEKYRKDLAHIEATFIRQTVREAIQDKFSKYTAEQLYSDKKEAVRKEIFDVLSAKGSILPSDGFVPTQFTISRMDPPEQVKQAIAAKVSMIQEAQRTEQEVRKKKALAEQDMIASKTRADTLKMQADAEAYANQKITSSISPVLVEYEKVKKWDGKLSQVTGGGSTMLQMK